MHPSNLFNYLNNNETRIERFKETLKSLILSNKGECVEISSSISDSCIYFFMNNSSSLLQIMPNKELKYTYANNAKFQNEIQTCIDIFEVSEIRNQKISKILEK